MKFHKSFIIDLFIIKFLLSDVYISNWLELISSKITQEIE